MKNNRWWAAVPLAVIVLLLVYNVLKHGRMEHPGKPLYEAHCGNCHGLQGEGIRELVPPVAGADYTQRNFGNIPCYIAFGLSDTILVNDRTFSQTMYPVKLNEIEIANIMNYMNAKFDIGQKEVNAQWVKEQLKNCDR